MRTLPEIVVSTTNSKLVSDVMTTAVVAAHEGAAFKEIVRAITRNRVGAVPVIDDDRHVVGIVSQSDLLTRIAGDDGSEPWGYPRTHERVLEKVHALIAADLMTRPAVTILATVPIAAAARLAAQARVRRLPVVDHAGVLVGIVTRGDLLRVYLRNDTDIRRDLDAALQDVIPIDLPLLDISVTDGVITLRGTLDSTTLKDHVMANARLIPGVVEVLDNLHTGESL